MLARSLRRQARKRKFDETYISEIKLDPFTETPSDTKAALDHIVSSFPREKFAFKLPAIVLKHQLYSVVVDKTTVDRELNLLRDNGKIRFFKLDSGTDEFAIVYSEDYVKHINRCAQAYGLVGNPSVQTFLNVILPTIKDVSIEKGSIKDELGFSDQMITCLMNLGVLNVRDARSWWLSIPGSALFMKNLLAGRKAILSLIKKRKYKEVLANELEQRNISTHSKLGIEYHIFDVTGADMVVQVQTTGGLLLRYTGADKKRARQRASKAK